ncbi:RHS repeat-associated core domain-containing protein [Nonomuraea sp. NPDC052265]|uniref:RHS repeat-associated core domain-containing protein n=1 Tax=Nonomuraea sp. NPDC052265 TaxID=3364374 RepID=UPI0037C61527
MAVRPRTADAAVGKSVPQPRWPSENDGTTVRAKGDARVRVLGRNIAEKAGVGGLLFTVDSRGPSQVRVSYDAITRAYGGSYGSRLRLVRLPGCALTTPDADECRTATPVTADNDAEARTLTADVQAGSAVLAAEAGPASALGDYRATPLAPAATWNSGGNSGDFTWSYPMRVPPVPGGLTPQLAIGYAASSQDGRTSSTNNQSSWVGEGFNLWPGSIERSYKACADDGAPKNNGVAPGDQCWTEDNATVTWNGKGGELIKAADGTWRVRGDDGTRFEKVTGTQNGDNDGEYWKATTTDGTQYFFGRNRLPRWETGRAQTESAWTMPVFGNDPGEPCHDADGFAKSSCRQAYRWNLDYVVDTHGNAIAYYYDKESNNYGRDVSLTDDAAYERGGRLTRIEYGMRADDLFAAPPAKVTFDTAERCIPDSAFDCAPAKIATAPDRWPDVPWDQNCAAECTKKGLISPTFWSRQRLVGITTQIRQADGSYHDIDTWTLRHAWGDADVDRALLLEGIKHTGKATGTPVTLPEVTFNHVQLRNRLDRVGDDIPPFIKYRLGAIFDEYGGQIEVQYSGEDCTLSALPTPETNTKRCFPAIWQPAGRDSPITDWFHKYVVTKVIRSDRTGRSPDMVTGYNYLGGAAWHFDDDDGLTRTKEKTWSQWRGYGQVQVTTGGDGEPLTLETHQYLRGMHGDRLNASGGVKNVTVSDGEGGTYTDADALAGFELKRTVHTGPGGAVHDKTVSTPWQHETASRTRSWGTSAAVLTGVATSRTWTAMDGGAWRQTRTDTTYDSVTGVPTQVDDQGDVARQDDDLCTRTTYAVNAAAWIRSLPSRVETVAVRCSATPSRPDQVVSDVRSFYDGGALDAAPAKGDVTRVEKIADYDGDTATYVPSVRTVYDGYGRVEAVTDAGGRTTTTGYTETAGLTTKTVTTSPPVTPGDAASAHVTTETLDPAFGLPTARTDPAGRTTHLAYDTLGRLTGVWSPGRATTGTPDTEYVYQVAEGRIGAVTTRTLTPTGGRHVTQELFDGLQRPRQTQIDGPGGGRLITDTFYDSRGNTARTYDLYYAAGAPEAALFGVATPGDVEAQTTFSYDGLNRETLRRFVTGNNDVQEKWRTVTTYGGDWVAVDPPDGATPTVVITDARGRRTALRQHDGASPTGPYQATTYTYTPAGQKATMRDPAGNTWSYTYDLRGRTTSTTDPDTGTTVTAYDDLDRPVKTTDARGRAIVPVYDPLGRVTEVHEGSATGALMASYTYDAVRKGDLVSQTRYSGGRAYTERIDAYDSAGRPVKYTLVIPQEEGALAGSYTFTTAYNPDGTIRTRGFPAAGGLPAENVTTTYDELSRPTRLTSNLGSYVTATAYSATGRPLQYELSTGGKKAWQTFTYEYGTGRLASARAEREGVPGTDRNATYTHDQAGSITSISDASRSGTDTQCFSYDRLQRLRQAWSQATPACAADPSGAAVGGPAPYWHSYAYDVTGSRTQEVLHGVGGTADTVRAYGNAPAGQGHRLGSVTQAGGAGARTETFGYDAAGNLTSRDTGSQDKAYTWDAGGLLAKVSTGDSDTSFVYSATDDRLIRRDAGGSTLYLPGMEVRVAAGAAVSAQPSAIRYYTHDGRTLAMRYSASGVRFLVPDHQGTTQLVIDAGNQSVTQRRLTPFGDERGQAPAGWPDEKAFVGGTEDASTGLTHLGARDYDPELGRFVSTDPLLLDSPQQMHGYSYAGNTPVTLSDPSGLAGCGNEGRVTLVAARDCDHDGDYYPPPGNHDKDHYPRPGGGGGGGGRGGGGGGGGGGGRGGGGGGGGGGYHPPPIGPVRVCSGWCAIKDKIGDFWGGDAGIPDLPGPGLPPLPPIGKDPTKCSITSPIACLRPPDFDWVSPFVGVRCNRFSCTVMFPRSVVRFISEFLDSRTGRYSMIALAAILGAAICEKPAGMSGPAALAVVAACSAAIGLVLDMGSEWLRKAKENGQCAGVTVLMPPFGPKMPTRTSDPAICPP